VRYGQRNGPLSVTGSNGRLDCANHIKRGICDNRRTLLSDVLLRQVMVALRRPLAPELVEEFVRTFVAEVSIANRQAELGREQAKLGCGGLIWGYRQMRSLLDLLKEGHGSAAMVGKLRKVERQQVSLAAGTAQPVPALHPNLPGLYRRKVEMLRLPWLISPRQRRRPRRCVA
jgi:site-specific DNA recombinase